MWSMLLTSFMPRRGGETYPYKTPGATPCRSLYRDRLIFDLPRRE